MRSTSLFETHIHIFSENSPSPHWIETVNEVFSSKGYFEVAYPPTQLGTYAIVTLEEWMDDNPSWQAVPGRNGKYFDYSSEQHYVVAWIRSRVDWALAEGSIELIGLLEEGHCPELGSDPDPTAKKVEGTKGEATRSNQRSWRSRAEKPGLLPQAGHRRRVRYQPRGLLPWMPSCVQQA